MKSFLRHNTTFSRLALAICVVLCVVFISQKALAEKQYRVEFQQAHTSEAIIPSSPASLGSEAPPSLSPDQLFASEPVLTPEDACRTMAASLPKKHNKSGFERHGSSKDLHNAPEFPRALAASTGVFFSWLNYELSFPQPSGMRGFIYYALPPPLSL